MKVMVIGRGNGHGIDLVAHVRKHFAVVGVERCVWKFFADLFELPNAALEFLVTTLDGIQLFKVDDVHQRGDLESGVACTFGVRHAFASRTDASQSWLFQFFVCESWEKVEASRSTERDTSCLGELTT